MIIFKDILSGDELISDTYDLIDVDNVAFEVDCKLMTRGTVQINTGANASEDPDGVKEDDPLEDGPTQVNDVVDGFRLNQTPPYDRKEEFAKAIMTYVKLLSKKMKENGVPDPKIDVITKGIRSYAQKKMKRFQDYEPYVGESFASESMPIFLNYREDGSTPYFTIWKHGLVEMKV